MHDGITTLYQKTVKRLAVAGLSAMTLGGILATPVWAMDSDDGDTIGLLRGTAVVYSDHDNEDDELDSDEWGCCFDFCQYLRPVLNAMPSNPNLY